MFGFFQHCILPGTESHKQGALDCAPTTSAKFDDPASNPVKNLPSCESTDEEIFQDENEENHAMNSIIKRQDEQSNEGDESWIPCSPRTPTNQQKLQNNDPIHDFKQQSTESFRVVETDKNHILMSSTKVVVFRKAMSPLEKPKLLHIHQRALAAKKKKKRRKNKDPQNDNTSTPVLSSSKLNLLNNHTTDAPAENSRKDNEEEASI